MSVPGAMGDSSMSIASDDLEGLSRKQGGHCVLSNGQRVVQPPSFPEIPKAIVPGGAGSSTGHVDRVIEPSVGYWRRQNRKWKWKLVASHDHSTAFAHSATIVAGTPRIAMISRIPACSASTSPLQRPIVYTVRREISPDFVTPSPSCFACLSWPWHRLGESAADPPFFPRGAS